MKKTNAITILCALALSAIVAPATGLANNTVGSDATTEFKANDGKEVNPTDPEKEKPTPIKPGEPGVDKPVVYPGGALRLNHIPTISFGVNDLESSQADYYAKFENVEEIEGGLVSERASYVEVADETGEFTGWTVNVASDGVFKSVKGNIQGTITLTNAVLRGLNGMDSQPDKAPTMASSVVVGKDAPTAEVMTAAAGKGFNTWQAVYGNSATTGTITGDDGTKRNAAVKLTVPAGQQIYAKTEYKASLVWTLQSAL